MDLEYIEAFLTLAPETWETFTTHHASSSLNLKSQF